MKPSRMYIELTNLFNGDVALGKVFGQCLASNGILVHTTPDDTRSQYCPSWKTKPPSQPGNPPTHPFTHPIDSTLWSSESSGMYCRVLHWMSADVSEVHAASTIRAMSAPWWRRQHAPLKRRSTFNLEHGSTSQKILSFILAAVRTWNLTNFYYVHNSPSLNTILIQMNPARTLTSHFINIHLNVILSYRFRLQSNHLDSGFQTLITLMRAIYPVHLILLYLIALTKFGVD
jgi:hypothetical protein